MANKLRGTTRPIEQKKFELRTLIHNRFDVEVVDVNTGEVKQRVQAFNVICNALWTRLLNTNNGKWAPNAYFNYVLYGSGTGTPSATDTTLFAQLGYKSISSSGYYYPVFDVAHGVISRQASVIINSDENVGDTITEVGIGYSSTAVVSHAMLQDMNGNPISITKTATDVIKIYATIFIHFPAGGWNNGSVLIPYSGGDNNTSVSFRGFYYALLGQNASSGSAPNTFYMSAARRTGFFDNSTHNYDFSSFPQPSPVIDVSTRKITLTARLQTTDFNRPNCVIGVGAGNLSGGTLVAYDFVYLLIPGSWFSVPEIKAEAIGTGDGTSTMFATAFPVNTLSKVSVDGVELPGCSARGGPAAIDYQQFVRYFNDTHGTEIAANGAAVYKVTESQVEDSGYRCTQSIRENSISSAIENPFYASVGISKWNCWLSTGNDYYNFTVQCSDDCATWTDVGTQRIRSNGADYNVPANLRHKRFWRFVNPENHQHTYSARPYADVADEAHNITLPSAPAAGAVITCDYYPACLAKDSDHVFDLTVEITLGEYQGV